MIPLSQRQQLSTWIDEAVTQGARRHRACQVVGISLRTLQRWQQGETLMCDGRTTRLRVPANKLSPEERARVLQVANGAEFAHLPPSQFVPILADRGEYIASEATFYRVLREENQLAHRLASRPTNKRTKLTPVRATAPNQCYSWDITYLATPIKGIFYYLYLFMDIYSRKIVGWQVYQEESAELASDVIRDICVRENIARDQVILHSDNGGPMKGATMLATLEKLGVTPSRSRPSVSNDNPYSESLFRTLKYRPEYPGEPFQSVLDARGWVSEFVRWYNEDHRHSAIRFVTPAQRHAGLDNAILEQREVVYETAKAKHPHRWSGNTRNWDHIEVVYLNPEKPTITGVDEKEGAIGP